LGLILDVMHQNWYSKLYEPVLDWET